MNQERGRKPVILMVDDNPVNLAEMFELLSEAGYEVRLAENGQRALEHAERARPDLILLDVLMPEMDGFALCSMLKGRPDTQAIPILFMTALTDTAHKVRGFQLGAVDYITKPFQHEEVLARVATHLALQNLRTKLQENEQRLSRIFEYAMDAIITLDEDRQVTMFNSAAEKMFRCTASEAIGDPLDRFLSQGFRQVLSEYMRGGREGPTSRPAIRAPEGLIAVRDERRRAFRRELRAIWVPEGLIAVRADGEEFPIEATVSRVEAAGQPIYTVILRDIKERRKAEAECSKLRGLTLYLQEEVRAAHTMEKLIGTSPALNQVKKLVAQVAGTDCTVLVTGETGTGKELIARALHNLSPRKEKILVKLNCAAIPAGLAESELFGHEKGAFTGALSRKLGRFELAEGGTLFLDEIGELSLDLQAKLLRVLQEGEFERVGGTHTLTVDVRIIAATSRDLTQLCRQGQFRTDLFYRLHVFPIELPPLRERQEDIPLLVQHFARNYAIKLGKRIEAIPERMMAALCGYPWPGNIRELQHLIERAVILTQGPQLAFVELFCRLDPSPEPSPLATLEAVERAHILKVLEATAGRLSGQGGAAQRLGLPSTTLRSRMEKLGIATGAKRYDIS